jgi:2Fe-2S ferredoxin
MPTITISKLNKTIEVELGANLMLSLLNAGLPVASSCAGDGICGKCKLSIIKGNNQLSIETEDEIFLKHKLSIQNDLRISCQTKVLGNIEVDASYW